MGFVLDFFVLCRFASLRGGTTKQSRELFFLDCFVPRNDAKRVWGQSHQILKFEILKFKILNIKIKAMNKTKRNLKSIIFSMVLAAGMMLPARGFAQTTEAETGGGLFRFGKLFNSEELFPDLVEEEPTADWTQGTDGLFGSNQNNPNGDGFWNNSTLFRKNGDRGTTGINGGIQNDDFGAPLGSGIAIRIGAGLGYVALKKKEDKQ